MDLFTHDPKTQIYEFYEKVEEICNFHATVLKFGDLLGVWWKLATNANFQHNISKFTPST